MLWDLRGAKCGGMTAGPWGPAHTPMLDTDFFSLWFVPSQLGDTNFCCSSPCVRPQVVLWDLRGAAGGGMTLGPRGPAHRPVLASMDMLPLLNEAIGFDADPTNPYPTGDLLSTCALPAISLNPRDQRSLAFVLEQGMAGEGPAKSLLLSSTLSF